MVSTSITILSPFLLVVASNVNIGATAPAQPTSSFGFGLHPNSLILGYPTLSNVAAHRRSSVSPTGVDFRDEKLSLEDTAKTDDEIRPQFQRRQHYVTSRGGRGGSDGERDAELMELLFMRPNGHVLGRRSRPLTARLNPIGLFQASRGKRYRFDPSVHPVEPNDDRWIDGADGADGDSGGSGNGSDKRRYMAATADLSPSGESRGVSDSESDMFWAVRGR